MTSKNLLAIYNRAIKSYLNRRLSLAIKVATEFAEPYKRKLSGLFSSTSKIYETFYKGLQDQLVLGSIFDMRLPTGASVDTQPCTLYAPKRKEPSAKYFKALNDFWVAASCVVNLANLASKSVDPWVLAYSIGTSCWSYYLGTDMAHGQAVALLVASATIILVLERAFWLGGHHPTLEHLADASMNGLHIMPQLVAEIQQQLGRHQARWSIGDEEQILRNMVKKFRFQPSSTFGVKGTEDRLDYQDSDLDGEFDSDMESSSSSEVEASLHLHETSSGYEESSTSDESDTQEGTEGRPERKEDIAIPTETGLSITSTDADRDEQGDEEQGPRQDPDFFLAKAELWASEEGIESNDEGSEQAEDRLATIRPFSRTDDGQYNNDGGSRAKSGEDGEGNGLDDDTDFVSCNSREVSSNTSVKGLSTIETQ